jgi:BASS family bile acid:Na+ symporter
MFVIMPIVAVAGARAFHVHPAVEIALVTLAVSPVPPILPNSALRAGATLDDTIGLLVAASLLSIGLVPLAMALIGLVLGLPLTAPFTMILRLMVFGILVPLACGMAVRQFAAGVAERLAKPVSVGGALLLLIPLLLILASTGRSMGALIGHGTLLSFVVFVAIGLSVGHWLGGPGQERRSVVALATATRHPGVAIAIVRENFPEQKLAVPAILLYLLVSVFVSLPYVRWRKTHGVLVGQR